MGINTQFPVKAAEYSNVTEMMMAAKLIKERLFNLPKAGEKARRNLMDATNEVLARKAEGDVLGDYGHIEQYLLLVEPGEDQDDKCITAARIFAYELCRSRNVNFMSIVGSRGGESTKDLHRAIFDVRDQFPGMSSTNIGRVFYREPRTVTDAIMRESKIRGKKIKPIHKSQIDKEAIKRLIQTGRSLTSIASTMNCSLRQVQNVRNIMGIEARKKQSSAQIDRESIQEMLLSGVKYDRVAIDLGVSERTVNRERRFLETQGKMKRENGRWYVVEEFKRVN